MLLGVESISSIGRVWFCLFGVVLSNVSMALLVYFSNSSSYFDFFRALVVGGLEMETNSIHHASQVIGFQGVGWH